MNHNDLVGLSIKLPTRRSAFDTSSYIIMLKHLLKNIWPPLVGIWNQDPKQFCIKNSQIREQLATQISWMEEILHSSDLILPLCAGKSFSEVLTLGSANSQYDKRLSIDLHTTSVHENSKLRTCCVHKLCFCFDIQNNLCEQHVLMLEFSRTELVIQLSIFSHVVG